MTGIVGAAAILLACAIGMVLARGRSAGLRLGIDAASIAALGVWLWPRGETPLLLSVPPPASAGDIWLRVIAAGWWLFAARAAVSLLRVVAGHDRRPREMRMVSDLLAAGIYVAAALIVVGYVLRLPVGGLLATSGLAAIVVGLALQNTLADVFAGIAVGIEQPFRVGDRVRLSDGTEGGVVEINWRSIRFRTDQDDLVIVPNSTVAKAQIVNRSSPSRRGMIRVDLVVAAAVDPDRVFDHLRTAALLTPDALDAFAPMTLLTRVGERTSGYACIFMVDDNGVAMRARSEFLRYARRQLSVSGGAATAPADIGRRLLREVTVFETLDDAQVAALADALALRRLAAGDTMFEQGSSEPLLYLVADGVIEIRRRADSGEQVLGRIGAGEYIGEIGLLTGAPREVRAVALTDARVHVLDKRALEPLLAGDAGLVDAFERSVRRGRQLLSRSLAAATSDAIDGPGDLIARIRRFFAKPERLAP